ncbi:MAG TPA: DegT/DnrJ/EryC1/StrS family aminotransferase [Streptosporangiaceae bacterium]|nr:DegT/DnrJ/EryC1/StrS family aminotransferase [Streptosporangiaceae bacterium]
MAHLTVDLPAGQDGVSRNALPYLHGHEAGAVARVLATGHYTHGPETELFEQQVAAFLGAPDVVAVASGTAALHIALIAAGIGPGDQVVVPSFTFCASVQAILACGATPRFADINPATLCVTADDLLEAVTPATRAVMPVLYGGRAVDLAGITPELAGRGITAVEDAAHAFGSRCHDRQVGSTGALTCFSFDPIKNLSCGEGGALVPRDPAEAERARRIRDLGITQSRAQRSAAISYTVEAFGLRAHLPAVNAAIGRAQLARFPAVAGRRTQLWRAYREALAGIDGVTLTDVDINRTVPFNCVVRIDRRRDEAFTRLRNQGIGVAVHYPPNHTQPAFAAWHRPLPSTELAAAQVLSLPFHPALGPQDAGRVAGLLREALR